MPAFTGRVLPFDLDASQAYADLMAQAKAAGKTIGRADGYIAATAAVRDLMVATRDTGPFIILVFYLFLRMVATRDTGPF